MPVFYIEMDGTGIPVVKAETEGRSGKVEGVPAHTREVKLGCVFTQTGTDQDKRGQIRLSHFPPISPHFPHTPMACKATRSRAAVNIAIRLRGTLRKRGGRA